MDERCIVAVYPEQVPDQALVQNAQPCWLAAQTMLTSCTQCFAKLVDFSDLCIFAQLCPVSDVRMKMH